MTDTFALKGNICYSESKTNIKTVHGYAVCSGGLSRGVYEALPEEFATVPVYDFGDSLIIPAMVDLHIHAPQYTFRGTGMDYELMQWLRNVAFPEEERYADSEYARRAYSAFADGLRRGATGRACIFATVHRRATEILMEEMEKSGVISLVGKVNMDRGAPEKIIESAQDSAEETVRWLEAVNGRFSRTEPILTPRFIPGCTDELMRRLGMIRRKYDLPVQSHLSENPEEAELVGRLYPQADFYGDGYDRYGMFGDVETHGASVRTVMAHCVWSDRREVGRLYENGVFVAHCPGSNLNLSSGIAPVRKYLDAGIRIGLGTDVAAGHSDSIFRAMTDAIQVSKMYWRYVDKGAAPLKFEEAFWMATRGGGEFFGRVGGFDSGYAFDALVVDDTSLRSPQRLPVSRRLERAVYLSLDITGGIKAKFVAGSRLF